MKKRISELARVQHMVEAARQIEKFMEGVDHEAFQQDRKLRLAATRLIEIIGEASNHVQDETKFAFSSVEWRVLYGIRNVLVHEYFGVDDEIIWAVTQRDIPVLRIQPGEILTQLTNNP